MPKRKRRPRNNVTIDGYTYRWDSDDEDELDAIFEVWEDRDWLSWLREHLRFPFQAQRMEMDGHWMTDPEGGWDGDCGGPRPFDLGLIVAVAGLSEGNEHVDWGFEGILMDAECLGKKGVVPLQDFEVVPPNDPNYGPVKEWVVRYANR